jgi:hypothetical protein
LKEIEMEFIVISEVGYPIDTDEERAEALTAMVDSGFAECAVYVGAPDPSSYASGKRFTSKGEVFFG